MGRLYLGLYGILRIHNVTFYRLITEIMNYMQIPVQYNLIVRLLLNEYVVFQNTCRRKKYFA